MKLRDQRTLKILGLVHSLLYFSARNYFEDSCKFESHGSAINTRFGSSLFRMPHRRTAVYDHSFTVTGCRLWNSLNYDIRLIDSYPRFVAALKEDFLGRISAASGLSAILPLCLRWENVCFFGFFCTLFSCSSYSSLYRSMPNCRFVRFWFFFQDKSWNVVLFTLCLVANFTHCVILNCNFFQIPIKSSPVQFGTLMHPPYPTLSC